MLARSAARRLFLRFGPRGLSSAVGFADAPRRLSSSTALADVAAALVPKFMTDFKLDWIPFERFIAATGTAAVYTLNVR